MKTIKYKLDWSQMDQKRIICCFCLYRHDPECPGPGEKGVKLVNVEDKQRVDVFVNGTFLHLTGIRENIEKSFLYPVYSPDGSVITRGYPH